MILLIQDACLALSIHCRVLIKPIIEREIHVLASFSSREQRGILYSNS
ncbi:hypothetical protein [Musicola paradisiaca]|uniref:Uncharacterized protein n=1 Tax=Musicola paradisiaca (strain Ech703) TaxID=579405 RepID=C6CDH5_MUSP7|nr:hypothetical protein [Musicola paradisiaca]ACS87046.1 hypothetical protein Dd703_3284 [Musicola paradisiaca Ech703]